MQPLSHSSKFPRVVLQNQESSFHSIFAFPPNRETLGGTAYLIVGNEGNILLDCPLWEEGNQQFLHQQGGVHWLFLTHRGGMGNVQEIQRSTRCKILVQEQEAYLLPGLELTPFQQEIPLPNGVLGIWTPGHSPGSACLYLPAWGGVLFSGRHLLPDPQGDLAPLRTSKTFHWRRQLASVQKLRDRFTSTTLQFICPGANTGFLRGKGAIDDAYSKLARLDLSTLPSANLQA